MNLKHKFAKLRFPSAYRSFWRGVRRAFHPLPVQRFLKRIDQSALAAVAARSENELLPGENWTKYFDASRWLKLNIRRAQDIGLDREKRPLRVLDLGSGAGYFLLVCQELGHQGIGLDVPEPAFYGRMFEILGLKRVVSPVEAEVPLPESLLHEGRFDLVTAFSITFNGPKTRQPWEAKQWGFLLDDLCQRFLAPGGRIYFDLNPGPDGRFMNDDLRDYFLRRGAQLDRRSKLLFAPTEQPGRRRRGPVPGGESAVWNVR